MRKGIKYLPIAVLVALLGSSCSVKNIEAYHDTKDNVYFDFEKNRKKVNFLNYTFFDAPTKADSLVKIPVRISGERVDYDRHFLVMAQAAEATQPAGTIYAQSPADYELETTGVIPAGEGMGYVMLTLKNQGNSMDPAQYYFTLKLELMPSDDFDTKLSGGTDPLGVGTVTFSRKLVMPDWWNKDVNGNYEGLLGPWKRTSNELFRVATGVKDLPLYEDTEDLLFASQNSGRFTSLMRNPEGWAASNPTVATTAPTVSEGGFATYTFAVTATGKVYYFRKNTTANVTEWKNEDNGLWDIYYQ